MTDSILKYEDLAVGGIKKWKHPILTIKLWIHGHKFKKPADNEELIRLYDVLGKSRNRKS